MAQSTSSGFHTYSSWGRTRRPKNVNGSSSTLHITSGEEYFTENQRFLHLSLDTDPSGNTRTVTVWGFMHASGRWAPLKDTSGIAVTTGAIADAQFHRVFEIAGVDKVYFQIDSALNGSDFLHAACSTF